MTHPIEKIIDMSDPYFGLVGDGVTDDSAAFAKARDLWKSMIRTNPVPGNNGNKYGTPKIIIPSGSYMIKQSQCMLDSTFTTRTYGMTWEGESASNVQIIYSPTSSGPLLYNNDAVIGLFFKNIRFVGLDGTSDFIDSVSAGGSQNYIFDTCHWEGTWQYGLHLTGTNNNSEMVWNKCCVNGVWSAYLFSDTSDQFLNYWFNQCSINSLTGGFIRMLKGGHIKINECDFSGHNPATASVLFSLEGNTHFNGVCSFIDHGSRYELKNSNMKVMYSEWPGGLIRFEGCDFSSQASLNANASTLVTHDFRFVNTPGPQIKFDGCVLMGLHNYVGGNSSHFYKKSVEYKNCDNKNFVDFYSMFTSSLDSGANYGSLPCICVNKCRGTQDYWFGYTSWAANTAYNLNDQRRSGVWLYTCTQAGTSGTQNPYGPGVITDGTVQWTSTSTVLNTDFISDGGVNSHKSRNPSCAKKSCVIRGGDGNWPARVNATTPGFSRAVLPPNSIITKITMSLPAGTLSQGTPGSYKVLTDQVSPTTFLDFISPGNLSSGFTMVWEGFYNCGTGLDSRSILLEAMTDVTQFAGHPALCLIEYINGD